MEFISFGTLASLLMDFLDYVLSYFWTTLGQNEDGDDKTHRKQDEVYFKSYADIGVHEDMLNDTIRTNAYRYAILRNYEAIRGHVVADVGSGTGILAIFCVQAGAKKVYAIEASDMARQAQSVVEENNMQDRIKVVQNTVERVQFPEYLDVIVSEWMGYCLFYESMLQSVIICRDKWLKKGGVVFPSTASLYMAPFSDAEYDRRLDFWSEIKSTYKLSMESMKSYARKCIAKQVHVNSIPSKSIQAHAQKVFYIDLNTVTLEESKIMQGAFTFHCFGHSAIHGFVVWFDVGFPDSITLSTSPYAEETHWSQTLFYLEEPCFVSQDTVIKGNISISPHSTASRFLDIRITYRIGNGTKKTQYYLMNDSFA